tara:strand:+ start:6576 stop:7181 length:606 start_codon:yes stop_codon:yes gene_type:complete
MHKQLVEPRIVLATHNAGKLEELNDLLKSYDIETVPIGNWDLPEPEENGKTFAENAEIKAVAAATATGLPALADDSGLMVEALDGFPGLQTARFMDTWEEKRAEVERRLGEHSNRRASYNCALALAWPNGQSTVFVGRADGMMVWPARGNHESFDPVFQPNGYAKTYAELGSAVKSGIDARAQAFKDLAKGCLQPATADQD